MIFYQKFPTKKYPFLVAFWSTWSDFHDRCTMVNIHYWKKKSLNLCYQLFDSSLIIIEFSSDFSEKSTLYECRLNIFDRTFLHNVINALHSIHWINKKNFKSFIKTSYFDNIITILPYFFYRSRTERI